MEAMRSIKSSRPVVAIRPIGIRAYSAAVARQSVAITMVETGHNVGLMKPEVTTAIMTVVTVTET